MLARRIGLLLVAAVLCARAAAPVYVLLWFDTEDYIEPAADDAALRIAQDLRQAGVHATFKVVGEKARTLEARGRTDVIRALAWHDIGYHSNFHSIQPTPAVYLRDLGWIEGAQEFRRREEPGVLDIRRIFGVAPSCYGQPGSSWGPQSFPALLAMGIGVYLDEGDNVGLDEQPFWYGGMLHVFGMGRFLIRPSLQDEARLPATLAQFDAAVRELRRRGGGVISTYYHPTEFVTAEFWDGANFAKGASPERSQWRRPRARTREEAERAYRILMRYAEHARGTQGVEFVTARQLPQFYRPAAVKAPPRETAGRHFAQRLTFLKTADGSFSAADLLMALLGLEPGHVEGPAARVPSTYSAAQIARPAFERARTDAAGFIRAHGRLPASVWIGSRELSIQDFAATLAADSGSGGVRVARGHAEMEKYISRDAVKAFAWPIHPEGFQAPGLLELGRLQAWTLKPAVLR